MRINSHKLSVAWRLIASLGFGLAVFAPPTPASAHAGAVIIEGVPSLKQKYSLSCEFAAAEAVTLFWGEQVVSQDHFIREVPNHPNPHRGFRGNIDGPHGGTSDYGIYAEPLVPVLESHGYDATVFYGGQSRLEAEIDEGHPVVVWITSGKDVSREGYYQTYDGERFKLVPYEHTVVVYGYDDGGIYLMDVGNGGKYYTEWESFLRRWSYFDQMALLIHPK
jgi:uncharacterized protein YvpB